MAELRCIGGPRDGEVIDVAGWRGHFINLPSVLTGFDPYYRTNVRGDPVLVYSRWTIQDAEAHMDGLRTDKLPVQ